MEVADIVNFYRATLCCAVSAVSRCPSVRPSVSPSVCPSFVHSIQTAEDIIKLLYRPGSPVILVFGPRRRYPIPRVTPSARVQNTREWENIAILD